jgi:inhibitor of KinA
MSDWPQIRTVGLSGILVSFADKMSEPANRAALAFRAAVDAADWPEVAETSTSLISVFLQVDLAQAAPEGVIEKLRDLLAQANWLDAPR